MARLVVAVPVGVRIGMVGVASCTRRFAFWMAGLPECDELIAGREIVVAACLLVVGLASGMKEFVFCAELVEHEVGFAPWMVVAG